MALVARKIQNTPRAIQPVFFSDFQTNFIVDEYKKDLVRQTNEEAVKTSIRNLIMTNRGDRLFNNTLGSDVRSILFENASPAMEQILSDYVTKTIENYEPRCGLISVIVNSELDSYSVGITITFNLINRQEPITLDLVLNRIR
jgi:phage baseplate assembly protein W